VKAAGGRSQVQQLSQTWLNELKSPLNDWCCLCDAGLCGSSPPRGIIFSLILQWLCTLAPEEDELALVRRFRNVFQEDPGLDGCLLEREEILKLKAGNSICSSLLTLIDQSWIPEDLIDFPPRETTALNHFQYRESISKLVDLSKSPSSSASWYLIEVPSGFDVIDVALVEVSNSPAIYGIQITRSAKPFAKHHTFDTCPSRSSERLDKLWGVISDHFKLNDTVNKFYVMLAPNCDGNEFRPPGGHLSDYFFSPARITAEYDPSNSRKRASHPVPARRLPVNKKCCQCKSGKCQSGKTNCRCNKNKTPCDPSCLCQQIGDDQKVLETDTEED
jgi:hypothetical protein